MIRLILPERLAKTLKMMKTERLYLRNIIRTLFISVLLTAAVIAPTTSAEELTGKVIMMKGRDVTIQVHDGDGVPREEDKVELSFVAGGESIRVGTWQVTRVKDDGTVEAGPVETDAPPGIGMDAVIHATGNMVAEKEVKDMVSPGADYVPPRKLAHEFKFSGRLELGDAVENRGGFVLQPRLVDYERFGPDENRNLDPNRVYTCTMRSRDFKPEIFADVYDHRGIATTESSGTTEDPREEDVFIATLTIQPCEGGQTSIGFTTVERAGLYHGGPVGDYQVRCVSQLYQK